MKEYRYLMLIPLVLIAACSDKDEQSTPALSDQSSNEHFLKDKTRTLEKARQVEQMLKVEADKQRQAIEKQSQ